MVDGWVADCDVLRQKPEQFMIARDINERK